MALCEIEEEHESREAERAAAWQREIGYQKLEAERKSKLQEKRGIWYRPEQNSHHYKALKRTRDQRSFARWSLAKRLSKTAAALRARRWRSKAKKNGLVLKTKRRRLPCGQQRPQAPRLPQKPASGAAEPDTGGAAAKKDPEATEQNLKNRRDLAAERARKYRERKRLQNGAPVKKQASQAAPANVTQQVAQQTTRKTPAQRAKEYRDRKRAEKQALAARQEEKGPSGERKEDAT